MYEETIDLTHLKPEGLKIERRVNQNAWKIIESDWISRGDLVFDAFLKGNAQKVDIRGSFQAGITANCHRCLKVFPMDISRSFHLTYLAADPDRFAREEVELSSQELEVAYLETHYLPIHEMIREQVYLSVPMKLLCRADCRGLCVHCGADLNEVECECPQVDQDARWAKLKMIVNKPE